MSFYHNILQFPLQMQDKINLLAKVLLMLAADDKIPQEMAPELLVKSTWL